MWYAIVGEDGPSSPALRKIHRPAHLERLSELNEVGRVLVAGPHPAIDSEDPGDAGFTGSLMIVAFDSLVEARAWANQDPYLLNGVFAKVTVNPFLKVLP